jgi:hypothetical protein
LLHLAGTTDSITDGSGGGREAIGFGEELVRQVGMVDPGQRVHTAAFRDRESSHAIG